MNWKKNSLGGLIADSVQTKVETGQMMQLWKQFFQEIDFSRPVNAKDTARLSHLSAFNRIYQDLRLKGQLKNAVQFAKYLTARDLTPEQRLEFTIQNYEIGREVERRFYAGIVNGPYMLTVEPHIPYNKQEGLWMLKLHDISLPGHPNIARIGVNFHIENNELVMSIGVIQGAKSKKQNLDRFMKQIKQPWPVFMVQTLEHCANIMGVKTIRGIPDNKQPFRNKSEFKSGKGAYSLYDATFQNIGFNHPTGSQEYFELPVKPLRQKRTKAFETIFPPTSMPKVPPRLKLPKPHR